MAKKNTKETEGKTTSAPVEETVKKPLKIVRNGIKLHLCLL